MDWFLTHAGTDIAKLGLWDAEIQPIDDKAMPYKHFWEALETDAKEGKLLFVNTHADGSYSMAVTCNESQFTGTFLQDYMLAKGDFFLDVPSGKLLVGGLEDYRSSKPQITSEKDVLTIEPGIYQVRAYANQYDEEKQVDFVKQTVGEETFEHHQSRALSGCNLALFMVVIGLTISFFWSFWALGIAVCASLGLLILKNRQNMNDESMAKVDQAFRDWEAQHPDFIFILKKTDALQPSKGFFNLEDDDAVPGNE